MSLNYILECDENIDELLITNKEEFDDTVCSNTIKMRSKYACERTEYIAWYDKLGISIYITALILITLGIFLSTFGATTFQKVISALVFLLGGVIITGLFMDLISDIKGNYLINF